MLNFFVNNNLKGNDYAVSKCSCGYSKKHYKQDNTAQNTNLELFCPDCGVPMLGYGESTALSFEPIKQSEKIFHIKEIKGKICAVEMYVYHLKGGYTIDFINKDLILEDKSKNASTAYKIVFDGTLKEEDMIKAYDLSTDTEVSIQSIIDNNENKYESYRLIKSFTNFEDLEKYMNRNFYNYINRSNLSSIRSYLNKYKTTCTECELLIKSGIDPGYIEEQFRNIQGSNPADFLNIKPYMVKFLRQNNSDGLINVLIKIDKLFKDQGVHYLNTFGQQRECLDIHFVENIYELIKEANLSINKLYRYLYKDAPIQQALYSPRETLRLLYDSFNLSKLLDLPFDKNPKALIRYHDILTKEYNTIKDEIVSSKFSEMVKRYNTLNYSLEDSDFEIVVPKESKELVVEGKIMKHCVASYIDKVVEGKSIVVFLRKKEDINQPYVTIEICPKYYSLLQIKEKHNGRLQDKKAISFVKQWCQHNAITWAEGHY